MLLNLQSWVLRVGSFALPLLVLPNTFDRYALARLATARLLAIALAAILILRLAFDDGFAWRRTTITLPLLALAASALLSTVGAVNRNVALFGTYLRYEGLLTIAMYALIFWVGVQLIEDASSATGVIRAMLAGAYLASVIGVLQAVIGWPTAPTAIDCESARAFGTMGSAYELATLLAMLLPLAVHEMLGATTGSARVIAANVTVVMMLALLLTFTRSAAVGAALGIGLVVLRHRPSLKGWISMAAVVAGLAAVTIALARFPIVGGLPIPECLVGRAAQLASPAIGTPAFRFHVWVDSIGLVAERPLLGYGPDTFGLVYPRVQSGNWAPGSLIDKAHADLVQTAVTQGLLGVAADLCVLGAFVWSYWRSRRTAVGAAVLGGWIGYQVATQVSFSWVLSAAPFWLFAAAAAVIWRDQRGPVRRRLLTARRTPALLAGLTGLCAVVLVAWTVGRPVLADVRFFSALEEIAHGRKAAAQFAIADARRLSPEQSVYAVEAGNLELGLDARGVPSANADWRAARDDYTTAVRLGTFNPAVYRYLALADEVAGDHAGALRAAQKAVELDRFDPVNEKSCGNCPLARYLRVGAGVPEGMRFHWLHLDRRAIVVGSTALTGIVVLAVVVAVSPLGSSFLKTRPAKAQAATNKAAPCTPIIQTPTSSYYPPVTTGPTYPYYPPVTTGPTYPYYPPVTTEPTSPYYPPVATGPTYPEYPPVTTGPTYPSYPPVTTGPTYPFYPPVTTGPTSQYYPPVTTGPYRPCPP